MKTKELMHLNDLKKKDQLKIGQKLKLPLSQEKIEAIASASYTVKEGDTLISIAKKFDLEPKELAAYNHIKNTAQIKVGTVLKLPLPYVLLAEKRKKEAAQAAKKKKKTYSSKLIRRFGKHKLRVTATAYSSHGNQTDSTPFLAAWNNRLRPGMKIIAVSRDLLYKYGMKNGTKVKIAGLPGYYRVRDKMNKRYKKRIDIYMGTNRRKALRWGRRSVVIYW
jgi:LysM repeat protein